MSVTFVRIHIELYSRRAARVVLIATSQEGRMTLAEARAVRQPLVMLEAPAGARFPDRPASLRTLSLEARLAMLHRRRRLAHLKHFLAAIGELLVGAMLLLAVFVAATALR